MTFRSSQSYMITSVRAKCRKCGHEWTYMGSRLELIGKTRRPVHVICGRCKARVRIDALNP
jgi:ribosomal protein L40E